MNSTRQVLWTDVAENDLKEIIEYISIRNPSNAKKILQKIKSKASSLYTLPEKGRVVPELQEQGISQYRELIISPWRLIYRIAEKEIYVLSLFDSRQNVEDILLKRFIH
ncbi:MAG: type II toxin-antitoxin system RelE/ParE family toxin [Desulfobacterales bacterium]|nr:type II toxin-antitoxin system RelE/ParE family toxin [Desulfobacterales bacterium]